MRVQKRPLAAHEAAGHLVDGADGSDGNAALDGFDDAVMVLGVDFVAAFDENDLRAHALGVGDDGSGAHAEGLGLVAGGDAAGGVGHHGHHADGPAAQLGPDLLLDGGEVGVQIDEEPVEQGSLSGIGVLERSSGSSRALALAAKLRFASSSGHSSGVGRAPDWGEQPSPLSIFAFYSLFCNSNSVPISGSNICPKALEV